MQCLRSPGKWSLSSTHHLLTTCVPSPSSGEALEEVAFEYDSRLASCSGRQSRSRHQIGEVQTEQYR